MGRLKKPGVYILLLALLVCGLTSLYWLIQPGPGSARPPTATSSISLTAAGGATEPNVTNPQDWEPLAEHLTEIDEFLSQSVQSSLAYNVPGRMALNETVTLELLMNPSLSPTQLAGQVGEPGQVVTAGIEITPLMKADLIPRDREALTVQPLHADSVQPISALDTTRWAWLVTGKKSGSQRVLLVVYRLVKFEGKEYWREVESYRAEINVEVTLGQWLGITGWKWLAALTLVALSLLVFRRRYARTEREIGWGAWRALEKLGHSGGKALGHIFISYRRSDSADIAGRIYDRLVEEFGRAPIFKDVDSIPLGTDFKQQLDQKVNETRVLLAIIGDRWLEAADAAGRRRLDDPADYVRMEIELALERGIQVIPLLVRGAQMPDEDQLPAGLKALVYRNGISIRPDPDFHNDMDRLITAIKDSI